MLGLRFATTAALAARLVAGSDPAGKTVRIAFPDGHAREIPLRVARESNTIFTAAYAPRISVGDALTELANQEGLLESLGTVLQAQNIEDFQAAKFQIEDYARATYQLFAQGDGEAAAEPLSPDAFLTEGTVVFALSNDAGTVCENLRKQLDGKREATGAELRSRRRETERKERLLKQAAAGGKGHLSEAEQIAWAQETNRSGRDEMRSRRRLAKAADLGYGGLPESEQESRVSEDSRARRDARRIQRRLEVARQNLSPEKLSQMSEDEQMAWALEFRMKGLDEERRQRRISTAIEAESVARAAGLASATAAAAAHAAQRAVASADTAVAAAASTDASVVAQQRGFLRGTAGKEGDV